MDKDAWNQAGYFLQKLHEKDCNLNYICYLPHLLNLMNEFDKTYTINLSFEEIKLPPFQDILVLAKNSVQGKIGLSKSFELLVPNGFETIDVDNENIETVFVNKNILAKIEKEKVIRILEKNVFGFISEGELISVDFKINITVKNIVIKDSDYEY